MITLTIGRQYRLWEAAGADRTSPILRGIFIDPRGYAVVANGLILAVVPCKIEGAPDDWQGVVVDARSYRHAVESIDETPKGVILGLEGDIVTLQSVGLATGTQLRLTPGTYPKWRTMIPKREDLRGEAIFHFDNRLLRKLTAALGGDGTSTMYVRQNRACLMLADEGAFGLLTPVFVDQDDKRERDLTAVLALRAEPNTAIPQ